MQLPTAVGVIALVLVFFIGYVEGGEKVPWEGGGIRSYIQADGSIHYTQYTNLPPRTRALGSTGAESNTSKNQSTVKVLAEAAAIGTASLLRSGAEFIGKQQADTNCRKKIGIQFGSDWRNISRAWYKENMGEGYGFGLNYRTNGTTIRCETDNDFNVTYMTINSQQVI